MRRRFSVLFYSLCWRVFLQSQSLPLMLPLHHTNEWASILALNNGTRTTVLAYGDTRTCILHSRRTHTSEIYFVRGVHKQLSWQSYATTYRIHMQTIDSPPLTRPPYGCRIHYSRWNTHTQNISDFFPSRFGCHTKRSASY